MYHYQLKIQIFSGSLFLETELRKMEPLRGFDHDIRTYPNLSSDVPVDGDVVIIDWPETEDIGPIRSFGGQAAVLILCLDQARLPLLQEVDFANLDEVWMKPYTKEYILFRCKRILSLIKLKKDYALTQAYLDTTINSIPDLVWYKDIQGSHLKINDAFCLCVGKTRRDIEGRHHAYIWDVGEEDYVRGEYVCLETEQMVLKERKTCLFDEKVKSKEGLRQFKTYKSPIFNDKGEVIGTVGVGHDVTDLRNMSTELDIILRSMPFAILVKNDQGFIINVNEKFEKYFKTPKNSVIGQTYDVWRSIALKSITMVNREGYSEAVLNGGGEQQILEIQEEPIADIFGKIVGQLCICRDVTKERTLEQQILLNSNTDFMTGLYNRRYFYEYISEHRRQRPVSLIYIDLDHFKKVNDTYGHQTGDDALKVTAKVLQDCFARDFLARIGGDEFLVAILGECSLELIEERAALLLAQMKQTFLATEHLGILSASIGIAQTHDPHMKIDTLLQQSDSALYEAKERGRGQYRIYS